LEAMKKILDRYSVRGISYNQAASAFWSIRAWFCQYQSRFFVEPHPLTSQWAFGSNKLPA
jgi:hypothetical protein